MWWGVAQDLFGPSKQEKTSYNQLNSASNFGVGLGETDTTLASNYMADIISGDPTRVARALAPQISAEQQRTQQAKNQIAQFSPRSGGTAAAVSDMDRGARTDITNLTGMLTGESVSGLANLGSSLFSTGLAGTEGTFGAAKGLHDQTWQQIMEFIKLAAAAAGGAA